MADVKIADLDGHAQLSDGDKIALQQTDGVCASSAVQIGLRLDGVTWWKGVEADDIVLAQTQDNGFLNVTEIALDVFKGRELHLWKAKAFGVHADVYNVVDAHDNLQGGNRYVFAWLKD